MSVLPLYVVVFAGGVLTILSPCILPVLPFVFTRAARPFLRETRPMLAEKNYCVTTTVATAGLDARRSYVKALHAIKRSSRDRCWPAAYIVDKQRQLVNGRAEASGTHEELLSQRGRCAELFELQAARYR